MTKTSIPERNEIDDKFKWRLEDIFPSDKKWEEAAETVRKELPEFKKYEGHLKDDAQTFFNFLKFSDKVSQLIEKVYVYANMRLHQDSRSSFYQSQTNKAEMLMVDLSNSTSSFVPEITNIPDDTIKKFMSEKPELKIYAHYIESITRKKEHVLSPNEEALLAKMGSFSNSAEDIFSMLNDADIAFPKIKDENGDEIELTKGRYIQFMESKNREVRKSAFNALYETYEKLKHTIAAAYYSNVKKDVFYSQVRKYPSSIAAALDDDKIPSKVYDNLISSVHKYLPLMHRYVKIRKKLLGLDELHMYDLYAPLVEDADMKITYDEAKQIVIKALAPMGDDYVSSLKNGLDGGWIDVYENKGKRGGAYSWGAYGVHPYVLLNHTNNLNSVFTLVHEMGHAMHSYYTWKTQPYVYSGHKIFVAEVASTCNESLLMEYMLKNTTDKKTRMYLINYFLEQFKGTFFRQAMFAEFEKKCHELVENGEPLTCDGMCEIYRKLNEQYFGDSLVIDKHIDFEWARIPHFYSAFYVYQYSTGYTAAIALSKKILKEGKTAVDKYIDFLSNGSSKYSIDLLKGTGVDMTKVEPFEEAMSVFEKLLDDMEKEI
jgi:oligoendopeptidase F